MNDSRAFVKLDFKNAFNSVRRDAIFSAVSEHRPDLLVFTESAYGSESYFWVGDDYVIASAEGVQQGEPLGLLLFCLALDVVNSHQATSTTWFWETLYLI